MQSSSSSTALLTYLVLFDLPHGLLAPYAQEMAPSVLIACLGNICRSPMGEAVLKHVAQERGLDLIVDSAGTSRYHIGEDPDDR